MKKSATPVFEETVSAYVNGGPPPEKTIESDEDVESIQLSGSTPGMEPQRQPDEEDKYLADTICKSHSNENTMLCKVHGFVCDECDCLMDKHGVKVLEDMAEEIRANMNKLREALADLKKKNDTQTIMELIKDAKQCRAEKEKRKTEYLKDLEKRLEEDEKRFGDKAEGLIGKFVKIQDGLKASERKIEAHDNKVKELTRGLSENPPANADLIRCYRYLEREFPMLASNYPIHDFSKERDMVKKLGKEKGELEAIIGSNGSLNPAAQPISSTLYCLPNLESEVYSYDLSKNKAKKICPSKMQKTPLHCGVAYTKDIIYVAGGLLEVEKPLKTVYKINLASNREDNLPSLSEARSENTLVIVGTFLVCMGGTSNNGLVSSIEALDLTSIRSGWKTISQLVPPRSFVSATASELHNRVYMFGGLEEDITSREFKAVKSLVPASKLNILNMEDKSMKTYDVRGIALHSAGLVLINDAPDNELKLLIMGGIALNKKETDKVYTWYHEETKEEDKSLGCADTFYSQKAIYIGSEVKVIGKKALHFYSEREQKAIKDWAPL